MYALVSKYLRIIAFERFIPIQRKNLKNIWQFFDIVEKLFTTHKISCYHK